jgi:hypothetical protein
VSSAPLGILIKALGEENADAALSALARAGYVCVPREPTKKMLEAAWADALGEDAAGVWSSMIAAAPNSA